MPGRALTDAERALAQGIFGDAIDLARVRVHHRRWWPFQPRETVMAPDGHIWCHQHGTTWRDCFASADLAAQGLFVHEMTHVWQAQRGGRFYLPLARHPFCRYDYALKPGRPFRRYGIEQQAEIVRHIFLLRQGIAPAGAGAEADYAGLLPFAGKPLRRAA